MAEYQKLLDEMKEPAASLRHAVPATWDGFLAMHHASMADGAVAARVKEAIALAISVVKGCDGCIAHYAQRTARLGATEAEVAEILAIALLIGCSLVRRNGTIACCTRSGRECVDAAGLPRAPQAERALGA